jgi:arylsulfatase
VLYALGGSGGGVCLFMDEGRLGYLYNMMIIEQYEGRSPAPLAPGRHSIVVTTAIAGPGRPGEVTVAVDGAESFRVKLPRTVPAVFTASESLDVGVDLGSMVSEAHHARRPFPFDGRIGTMRVRVGK